ncbi:MAG: DNA cytosine methyltransferase, partial [Oscillospiraceae bacterium]|nr:DNA cytosine methyltransferase [Oscillospiraceae bacterium]
KCDGIFVCEAPSGNKKHLNHQRINGRYASIARSYENNGTVGTVYNITVDGDHTYIVEGKCVHNCQSFSVAGGRAGLDGASGLVRSYFDLLAAARPRWFVWENVPGALTSNGGRDFGFILNQFQKCGYHDLAWRVLDTQYVRVDGFPNAIPQRRRRVFAVGHLGDGARAGEVLFECDRVLGNTPPRRIKTKEVASAVGGGVADAVQCIDRGGGRSQQRIDIEVSPTITTTHDGAHIVAGNFKRESMCWDGGKCADTITTTSHNQYMPDKQKMEGVVEAIGVDRWNQSGHAELMPTMRTNSGADNMPTVCQAIGFKAGQSAASRSLGEHDEVACTLGAEVSGVEPTVCVNIAPPVAPCIDADTAKGVNNQNADFGKV